MQLNDKKRKLIEFLAEKNILVTPEFLRELSSTKDPAKISDLINKQITASESEKEVKNEGTVNIIFSYNEPPAKISAQNFINHFNSRYTSMKKILQQREQLNNIISINKIKTKTEKDKTAIIGLVYSKEDTKNGIMLTLEDPTGNIKVFFGKSKLELYSRAKDIVLDDVIGITGSVGKNIIFANDVIFPDIPVTKEIKKSPIEEYAVFLSDIHVGSKKFLEEDFKKFINWIRGDIGSEKQKSIASKVRYVFIIGDTVDGISIYPSQKEELQIMTFKEQYKKLAEYLKLIPSNIKIIISPGQHDIVPLAEPQFPLPKEYCKELYELPNLVFVSNPAMVNIASREGFSGFDVLIYHGDSYSHYADVVESIRVQKQNISERAEYVMRLLLQKRHLSPTYDASPHVPTENDYMFIDRIPDLFISGDVHRSAVFNYKNGITGILSSCFQSKTSFQDKVGHVPDPGRVPIINLKTRDVKVLNFSTGE